MRTLFTAVAALLAMTASALAQNVAYDFDRSVDFHSFCTYAWVHGAALADPVNDETIVNAVSRELASRGFQPAVAQHPGPDLLVAYHTSLDRDVKVKGLLKGWGPYQFRAPTGEHEPGGATAGGTITHDRILRGTLIVDIIDARTNAIIWRGTATKEIDARNDPSKLSEYIDRASERLFKNFPPVH